MANLYGVANAPGLPVYVGTIGGSNIVCPAGANTPVWTSPPIIAPSQGYFFAICWMFCNVDIGAAYPNGIFWAAQIGSGSYSFQASTAGPFPVNTNVQLSSLDVTAVSQAAWVSPGSTVTGIVAPNTNPITITFGGSYMVVWLVRAPDQ